MSLNYKWKLSDGYKEKNGLSVFSCFACGGGSTMGYKLAGYDVIGANDIDKEMEMIYKQNHHPKYYFLSDIREFLKRDDLPTELFNLDILDGSPPCSSFSTAGNREKDWGKKKKFREGQEMQTLDDLFFEFIKLAEKLKPKVVVAENVKGMLIGEAKKYVHRIKSEFDKAGYNTQLFLLNAATMGVPQVRQRVFFISTRKDLEMPNIELTFNEQPILLKDVESNATTTLGKKITDAYSRWWKDTPPGKNLAVAHPNGSFFNSYKVSPHKVLNTITATTGAKMIHYAHPNELSDELLCLCGSYPIDYDFMGLEAKYVIGMSVPPLMIARIAEQIKIQLFKRP